MENQQPHLSVYRGYRRGNPKQLSNSGINNWKAGVGRALKKYIPDGTEVKGKTCEDCGSHNLIYQEGCLMCTDCGSSKCG